MSDDKTSSMANENESQKEESESPEKTKEDLQKIDAEIYEKRKAELAELEGRVDKKTKELAGIIDEYKKEGRALSDSNTKTKEQIAKDM
ncbi:MAG: hypothetical protein KKB51_02935, partial [Candidatus Riflebacteria bacterium]|nr:hypothetical protein [Candidatus Riflebacteria bacterium]